MRLEGRTTGVLCLPCEYASIDATQGLACQIIGQKFCIENGGSHHACHSHNNKELVIEVSKTDNMISWTVQRHLRESGLGGACPILATCLEPRQIKSNQADTQGSRPYGKVRQLI